MPVIEPQTLAIEEGSEEMGMDDVLAMLREEDRK